MKAIKPSRTPNKPTINLDMVVPADLPVACPHEGGAYTEDNDRWPFPLQQLLRIARQSGIAESSACTSTTTILMTSQAMNACWLRILKPLGLSEGRFYTMVTLFALDPTPSSSADLAYHARVTRPAMTAMLDNMAERGWLKRERGRRDRRYSYISLTDEGRSAIAYAVYKVLKSVGYISEELELPEHRMLELLCARLHQKCLSHDS